MTQTVQGKGLNWEEMEPVMPLERAMKQKPKRLIDLVASGYEFICSSCGTLNTLPEVYEGVACGSCNKVFRVGSVEHAY